MRRFRSRRLKKVNIEALMVAVGQNIKRLVGASRRGPRSLPQAAALHFPEPPFSSSRCCARKRHRCVLRRRRRRFSTRWFVTQPVERAPSTRVNINATRCQEIHSTTYQRAATIAAFPILLLIVVAFLFTILAASLVSTV